MIQIAVIGLSEAGKTVYLTSLINHLLRKDLANILQDLDLSGVAIGQSKKSWWPSFLSRSKLEIKPFPYEKYIHSFSLEKPEWPERTRDVYDYSLELTYRRANFRTAKKTEIRFLDYPGELIADFPMIKQEFIEWSNTINNVLRYEQNVDWEQICHNLPIDKIEPGLEKYFSIVKDLEKKGFNYIQPSSFFGPKRLPDLQDFEKFFPIKITSENKRSPVVKELEKRFNNYKKKIVTPAFEILQSCQYQIILVDIVTTLAMGIDHKNDTTYCIEKILEQFDYLPSGWWFKRKPIKQISFLATKSDAVVRDQRDNLCDLLKEMVETSVKKIRIQATLPNCPFKTTISHVGAMRCTEDVEENGKVELAIQKDGALHKINNILPIPKTWPKSKAEFDQIREKGTLLDFPPRGLFQLHGAVIQDLNLDRNFLEMIEQDLT